ncbi:hypothetical protein MGSAQ_000947, partial [marine sediment metagenome]
IFAIDNDQLFIFYESLSSNNFFEALYLNNTALLQGNNNKET